MKHILLALIAVVSLSACNEERLAKYAELRKNPEVSDIGNVDSCHVKYVNRGQSVDSFFIARCDNTTTTTQNYSTSGKSQTPLRSTVIEIELKKLQAEKDAAEAKEKALAKLSDNERKALGLE